MLMVIFGAGASYDSCATYRPRMPAPPLSPPEAASAEYHRPPLANSLFDNRDTFIHALDAFPQCKDIVPFLRDVSIRQGAPSVESTLQRVQEETDPRRQQTLAAVQCYLYEAIRMCQERWSALTGGVSNYLTLLRGIEETHSRAERVSLVTFNYDTLLEDAMARRGHKIAAFEDYVGGESVFRMFKLHGSINWAREADYDLPSGLNLAHGPSVLQHLVENADHIHISDRFVFGNPTVNSRNANRPWFPAIAIPVERKSQFECPPIILNELKEVLPSVTSILVIGWRAKEEHFLNLLNDNLKPPVRIFVVDKDLQAAGRTAAHLKSSLGKCQPDVGGEPAMGFSEFVLSPRCSQILKEPITK